jgi:hypothetical protein
MDLSGTWVNARNSVLKITQTGNRIVGTFDSGVSDGGVVTVDIIGWTVGDLISFTTYYEKFTTIVAWVGQVVGEPGNPQIVSQFLHQNNIDDASEITDLWFSTKVGSDTFVKRDSASSSGATT